MQLAHDLDAVANRSPDLAERFEPGLQVGQADHLTACGWRVDVERPDLHGRVAFGKQALGKRAGIAHEGDLIVIRTKRFVSR